MLDCATGPKAAAHLPKYGKALYYQTRNVLGAWAAEDVEAKIGPSEGSF